MVTPQHSTNTHTKKKVTFFFLAKPFFSKKKTKKRTTSLHLWWEPERKKKEKNERHLFPSCMLFSSSYSLIFSQCFQITCTRLGQHSCECRMKATIEESSVQRRSGGVRTPWQHTTLLIVFTRERRSPTITTTCILKKKKTRRQKVKGRTKRG